MELGGVNAIITGGGSGLGAAAAEELVAAGCRVALFDRDFEAAEAVARRLGASVTAYAVDVTETESVERALVDHETKHGSARLLLNAAGISVAEDVVDEHGDPAPLETFKRVNDINLTGSYNCLRLFSARLAANGVEDEDRGVIINVSSIAALDGQNARAAYVASKGGIAAMTPTLARNLAAHRIRAMAIAPGLFRTPLIERLAAELGGEHPAMKLLVHPKRMGEPAEFARLVRFIGEMAYLNGSVIRLDGAVRST